MMVKRDWHWQAAAYLISQNLFVFGSSTVFYAILWHIALVTSSGAWMTYVSLATTLPTILISLFAGVWADRYNRKWLIIGAAGAVTVVTLFFAFLYTVQVHELGLLLAIAVVRALGTGIETPAANALLPQLVPHAAITRMNGLNQVVMSVMLLLSPLLSGWILADLGIIWIFLVDALSALLAVMFLWSLQVATPVRQDGEQKGSQIIGGLRYVRMNQILLPFMILTACAFILIAPSSQLSTLYVNRTFGSEVWHLTFNEWAWTLGASITGLWIAWRKQFANKITMIAIGMAVSGLCFAEMGLSQPFLLYLTFMFLSGVAYPLITALQTIYLQETVDQNMMGRVFSLWQILSTGIYPIAMLGYGPLADKIPIGIIFIVTGVLLIGVAGSFKIVVSKR
ncbi:MFS transporter [Schleiferilactobacillus perolens]|jgi:DHA3 family macrolide efflux protein-like MFS transporter|uniref:MFS transporter n=1 Tax=Schleiferilactobacillus perolens TaxID=100468 RepID=UPI003B5CD612